MAAAGGFGDDPTFRAWAAAPAEFRSTLMQRIGTYANYLVQYIKREKLSGQVLCKYQGVYDSLFGQKPGRFKARKQGSVYRGTLYRSFGAQVYNDPAIQFFETIYGRAWEFGFDRKQYTVEPIRNRPRATLMFFAGGAWRFTKKVTIPAQTFPAKPHIQPAIEETSDRFLTLIWRPWSRFLRGGGR